MSMSCRCGNENITRLLYPEIAESIPLTGSSTPNKDSFFKKKGLVAGGRSAGPVGSSFQSLAPYKRLRRSCTIPARSLISIFINDIYHTLGTQPPSSNPSPTGLDLRSLSQSRPRLSSSLSATVLISGERFAAELQSDRQAQFCLVSCC